MGKQAWAEPTRELRSLFPDVEGLRLRSKRSGKTVYQVLFEVDGKSKAL